MKRRRAALWILAAVAACTPGESPPPVDADGSRTGSVVEELRLGQIDGPEEFSFGRIDDVAQAPDGDLYIADAQVPIIRRYTAAGEFLNAVGRGGEGPGEYQNIDDMSVTDDGELLVLDSRLGRATRYTRDGDLVDSRSVGLFYQSRATASGDFYLRMPPGGVFSEGPDAPPWRWVAWTEAGDTTFLHLDVPEDSEGPRYVISGRGGFYEPFNVKNISALGPDGSMYVGRNDAYRIVRTYPDGDSAVITRDRERVRVTPEELDQWDAYSEYFADRAQGQVDRSRFFPVPEVKPHFRQMFVDDDGRLWVGLYTEPIRAPYDPGVLEERAAEGLPSLPLRTALRWDIFGPDNDYVGTAEFPPRTTIYEASGDEVWGAMTGSFDVDHVVRWRLGLDR